MNPEDVAKVGLTYTLGTALVGILCAGKRLHLPMAIFFLSLSPSPFYRISRVLQELGMHYSWIWRVNKTLMMASATVLQLGLLPLTITRFGLISCAGLTLRQVFTQRWPLLVACGLWTCLNIATFSVQAKL